MFILVSSGNELGLLEDNSSVCFCHFMQQMSLPLIMTFQVVYISSVIFV